jgi:hypothetical protein
LASDKEDPAEVKVRKTLLGALLGGGLGAGVGAVSHAPTISQEQLIALQQHIADTAARREKELTQAFGMGETAGGRKISEEVYRRVHADPEAFLTQIGVKPAAPDFTI